MRAIGKDEIQTRDDYERQRPDLRRRIMTLKARRRVPLGDHATLHFETRDTMLYQVHEMLRAEDSWQRPGAVEAEREAYNPLIPADGALTATLMIELMDGQMAETATLLLAEAHGHPERLNDLTAGIEALRDARVRRKRLTLEFQIVDAQGRLLSRSAHAPTVPDGQAGVRRHRP